MVTPSDTTFVLHVEDDQDFAELTTTVLERENDDFTVLTAENADEALEVLSENDVDCVVSDFDMPGPNGIELFDDVRAVDSEVPYILFTGKGSEEIASDAISAGVTDYIQKGSGSGQYAVLANRISNAVEQYRRRTEQRRRRERKDRQWDALLELTTDDAVIAGDLDAALERITETAADVLAVDRVNVWLFDEKRDVLQCVDNYDQSTDEHGGEMELVAENHPAYFEALESNRSIAAVDAFEDPRTSSLEEYLLEHDVGALLDATIRSDGAVVGVICHEHGGEAREWTDTETEFASDVAELVHRALRNHERTERAGELEDIRARFHALTRNPSLGVVTIDQESTVRYANDAVEEILGHPPEDLVGESLLTIMPDRFHERHQEATARYLREGTRQLDWDWIELPGRHRDGHEVSLGISFGEAVVDGRSQFTAILRDITEREERRREFERIRDLLDHTERIANVGGWELDAETMDIYWTDHLFELLGVDQEEEPPLDEALDVYHEDDRTVVESAVEDALETGSSFDLEVRFRRPDDEVRWLHVLGTPTVEDGTVVSLRGAVQDITEPRRRVRVLQDMYDVIADRDRYFSEQVESLLELGRAELDTEFGTLSHIDGEEYVFEVVAADDDSIKAGDVAPVSATNCEIAATTQETLVLGDVARDAPDETDRAGYTEWGVSCYIGAPIVLDDDVYGTFCFYGTEARDGQFSDWEQTLVDLMSRWVTYELQRRQTNERLQEKNSQLEQFASILSHDLRNPMGVADGSIELARETGDMAHLTRAAAAIDRMSALVEDLLTLVREGDVVAEREPVDLSSVVDGCWEIVETAGVTLVADLDRTVLADESRLKQIFENLIRNAIEHGSGATTITVGVLPDGFYVADDGAGIPADERDDVFEPGYSTSEEGTGFGLRIVERFVHAHDWSIAVTESEDGGARFEITGVKFEE